MVVVCLHQAVQAVLILAMVEVMAAVAAVVVGLILMVARAVLAAVLVDIQVMAVLVAAWRLTEKTLMMVSPVAQGLEAVAAVAAADLAALAAAELVYLDRVAMALAAQWLALRPGKKVVEVAPEARGQIVLVAVHPVVVVLTAAVVAVGVTMLDPLMEVMEPSVLFGPVQHVLSRPQTQEIYKWNSLFAFKMVSLLNIQ
jgi:hypothetical protein